MEFFSEYAIFLAKTVTLVIAILVVLASFAALRSKGRRKSSGQLRLLPHQPVAVGVVGQDATGGSSGSCRGGGAF